jgi:hypothetical protein
MLQPGPTPYLPPTLTYGERHSPLYLERLTSASGISRSLIASVLAQVHGPWLLHIGPVERIAVLETMSGMYSSLGFRRKEAYILREVLGCILDLLVCGREEDGHSGVPTSSAVLGLAIQGIQGITPGGNQSDKRGIVGVKPNESTEGNESILRLLKYVCRVLGVDLDAVRLLQVDTDISATDEESNYPSTEDDALTLMRDPCGWPELQVGIIREAVAVAEALPGSLFRCCPNHSKRLRENIFRRTRSRAICLVSAQDSPYSLASWRPISPLCYFYSSIVNGASKRGYQICRILVRDTNP